MAIIDIDVIKYNPESDDAIAWKFPREDISFGAQLIVNESQEAIFFKDGKVVDTFGPGRHELTTDNMPWLRGLVKFSLGGRTPYAAEVWYVNKTVMRGLKWGTKNPLPVEQPRNNGNITVHARAYGSWGMQVTEPQNFITHIVGAQTSSSPKGHIGSERVEEYFDTAIQQQLNVVLNNFFAERQISISEANRHNAALAESIKHGIGPEFQRYGIEIESFHVESVNIPKEESDMLQALDLKEQEENREFEMKNREFEMINQLPEAYNTKRTFDVLEKTAENPGGGAGQLLGAGFGLGAGLGAGVPLGEKIGSAMDIQSKTSDPIESDTQNDPVAKLQQLKQMLADELITEEEFNEKKKQILDSM